jgi:anti-repressor protein
MKRMDKPMDNLQELLPISTEGSLGNVVDARALHRALGSKQQFADWIKFRLQEIDATPEIEYVQYRVSEKTETGLSNRIEFAVTTDTAKEIAMLERNDKGKAIRKYFIDHERNTRAKPLTRADLARMVLDQESELEKQKTLSLEQKPMVDAYEEIMSSEGLMSVAKVAKLLNTGEIKLFAQLRARGVLMDGKRSGLENHNLPYQVHLDAGRFEVKVRNVDTPTGSRLTTTTLVTGKGLEYIRRLLERWEDNPDGNPNGNEAGQEPID